MKIARTPDETGTRIACHLPRRLKTMRRLAEEAVVETTNVLQYEEVERATMGHDRDGIGVTRKTPLDGEGVLMKTTVLLGLGEDRTTIHHHEGDETEVNFPSMITKRGKALGDLIWTTYHGNLLAGPIKRAT